MTKHTYNPGVMRGYGKPTKHTYIPTDYPPGLVAVPTQAWMWTDSAIAFAYLSKGFPPGSGLRFGRYSSSAAWNRNKLTEDFLRDAPKYGWEWILYIDSDMTPPPVTMMRLLSHNVDCVGALAFSRRAPHVAEFGRIKNDTSGPINGPDGIVPVLWTGAGCFLVRRSVLEKMPDPWWEHPNPGEGEDILFCAKVRSLGFPVYVDSGFVVGHMTTLAITDKEAFAYCESLEKEGADIPRASSGNERYDKRMRDALARLPLNPVTGEAIPPTLKREATAYDANGVRIDLPAAAR